ncbi:transporter [Acinetobacter stercoris]|uniref:Transporter n=1 Tax=Acinetobacter stercoris TaxID=2126983 RepID=A0A2U3MU38_9GAMM|nr:MULTISPECIES: transporter [Acinetobacter]SPL68936.1 hypothetical protein KPC_0114 [Acinetobacter stercoris]
MKILQKLALVGASVISMGSMAADFSFDRPGEGFGTSITPVGQLAWEQALPSATYKEETVDGAKKKTVTLGGDMLFRTGLTKSLELQLGWDGPMWSQTKYKGRSHDDDGLGDVSIGLKHAIDLKDDKLSMAVLARAKIATGNDGFSEHDDIYTLGSSLNYKYNDLLNTGMTMYYSMQNSNVSVTAIPNISYKVAGNLSGFSEFVYHKEESQRNEYGVNTGLIYALNNRIQLDGSVGVDFQSEDKNYRAGLGVSFLF